MPIPLYLLKVPCAHSRKWLLTARACGSLPTHLPTPCTDEATSAKVSAPRKQLPTNGQAWLHTEKLLWLLGGTALRHVLHSPPENPSGSEFLSPKAVTYSFNIPNGGFLSFTVSLPLSPARASCLPSQMYSLHMNLTLRICFIIFKTFF